MLNGLKMAGNAMMLMGAIALLNQNREHAKQVAETDGKEYDEKATDTDTIVEVMDSVYLELERKCATFEQNPNVYRSLNDAQSTMRMTCNNDTYFLSIEELARLLNIKFDMSQVVETSTFLSPSKRDKIKNT